MAKFHYNATGIEMNDYRLVPEGDCNLRIIKVTDSTSKNGDPQAIVDYEVYDGDFKGAVLKYHYITFFTDKTNKAAGIAVNYLKSIGEPWEGDFEVNTDRWVGKVVLGHVVHESYNGKTFAKVKWVNPAVVDYTVQAEEKKDEDVPF